MQDTLGKGGGHMFVVFIWCGSGGRVIDLSYVDDYDSHIVSISCASEILHNPH